MNKSGKIVEVIIEYDGSALAVDHTGSDSVLSLTDVLDFDPEVSASQPGRLRVGDDDDAPEFDYIAVDRDAETVTIDGSLGDDYDTDTPVQVLPLAPQKLAAIAIGLDEDAPLQDIRVPHFLDAQLTEGVRDDETAESVMIATDSDGSWYVADIIGRPAEIQGSTIVGGLPNANIPPPAPVAPSSSPTPVVDGFQGVVLLRWLAVVNDTFVEYDVHVSASNGSAPDASTLVDSTGASMASVRTLADGTPLAYDTTYYFALWARSGDQLAPAPSAWVAGQMDKTRNADLAADAIDGMVITGATVRTAAAGQRVQMDVTGIHSFGPSGDETASLEAGTGGMRLGGSLVVDGEIATGDSGQRVVMDEDGVILWTDSVVQMSAWSTTGQCFGIAIDSSGNVYVTDLNSSLVRKYNASGTQVDSWSTTGVPGAIAIDSSGNVYVTEASGLLRKFNAAGSQVASWSVPTSVYGIAIDSSGNVYVTDLNSSLVRKYNASGTQVDSWSTTGFPYGLALDSSGNVYVADYTNELIRKYSSTGAAIDSWPTTGAPFAVALDPLGNVYVTTWVDTLLYRYDSAGTEIDSWQISAPSAAIALDSSGDLYATDPGENLVRKFNASRRTVEAVAIDPVARKLTAFNADFAGTVKAGEVIADKVSVPAPPRLDLSGFATGVTVSVFDLRAVDKWREIRGALSRNLSTGSTDVSTALPLEHRPSETAFTTAYLAGGNVGAAFIRPDGTIAINNMSGSARNGSHRFSIVYTVE